METTWPNYWCCLTPGFQAMLNFMGGITALPDPVVALTTYDANWEADVGPVGTDIYNYFANTFDITFGEVEVLPGVFLEAAIWTIDMYLGFNVFALTDAYTCPSPCPYTSGFFALPPS